MLEICALNIIILIYRVFEFKLAFGVEFFFLASRYIRNGTAFQYYRYACVIYYVLVTKMNLKKNLIEYRQRLLFILLCCSVDANMFHN